MDIQFLGSNIILSTYIKLNHNIEFLVYFPIQCWYGRNCNFGTERALFSILGDTVIDHSFIPEYKTFQGFQFGGKREDGQGASSRWGTQRSFGSLQVVTCLNLSPGCIDNWDSYFQAPNYS